MSKQLRVLFFFCIISAIAPITTIGQSWNQKSKNVANIRKTHSALMGEVVAIDGEYAIVGAYNEDYDSAGNNAVTDAGAAYILRLANDTWKQEKMLTKRIRSVRDWFGYSVDIDGDYAVVGVVADDTDENNKNVKDGAGAVYIYKKFNGDWTEQQKIVASDRQSNDGFGRAVAIYRNYIIVCSSSNVDADPSTITNSGTAYVFKRTNNTWSEVQMVFPTDKDAEDFFGTSVAMSDNYAIISASLDEHDSAGQDSIYRAGSAYIYKIDADTLTLLNKVVAGDRRENDQFGWSVGIDGDYAVVGSKFNDYDVNNMNQMQGAGAAYIFKNTNDTWSQVQKIVASDRLSSFEFGFSVGIDSNYLVVGSWKHGKTTTPKIARSGAAYVFELKNGTWTEDNILIANDREESDWLGKSVAISGNQIIAGAPGEDYDRTGQPSLTGTGAVYFFEGPFICRTLSSSFDLTTCDSFRTPSGKFVWKQSGTYYDTLKSFRNCDSIITYNLTVNKTDFKTENIQACDSFTSGSGKYVWKQSGTYLDTLLNISGCDSIITYDLTILNKSTFSYNFQACDSFASPSGNYTWTSSGVYFDTITNVSGCDSILIIDLKINNNKRKSIDVSECSSYSSPSGRYNWDSSGLYQDTLSTTTGCDSIISINLTILNSSSDIDIITCRTYVSPSGRYSLDSTGIYYDTIPNYLNCDSFITINLQINPLNNTLIKDGSTLISLEDSASYQWLNCQLNFQHITDSTRQSFQPSESGSYSVEISQNGCKDTSDCLEVIISNLEDLQQLGINIFPNPVRNKVNIDLSNFADPLTLTLFNYQGKELKVLELKSNRLNTLNLAHSGVYILRFKTTNDKIFTYKIINL